ncbi:MAG: hypothetical protein IIA62_08295 [Nitrospinae bacterium]|nr:hypothetical protein [Nitrospinota bacterium]
MSSQGLLVEIKSHLPLTAYGNGPVLELLREMGSPVNKKTPLNVTDVFRSSESGEIICEIAMDGKGKVTAALANLRLEITHPLFRKVKNYRDEEANKEAPEKTGRPSQDVNRESFRAGDLFRNIKKG